MNAEIVMADTVKMFRRNRVGARSGPWNSPALFE